MLRVNVNGASRSKQAPLHLLVADIFAQARNYFNDTPKLVQLAWQAGRCEPTGY